MKRRSVWFVALILVAHLAMRTLGLGAHMSVLAGMPIDATSFVIAPIYLVVYLLVVLVAPVLLLAGAIDVAQRFHIRARRR